MFSIGDRVTIHIGTKKVTYWIEGAESSSKEEINVPDGAIGVVKDKITNEYIYIVEFPLPNDPSQKVLSEFVDEELQIAH